VAGLERSTSYSLRRCWSKTRNGGEEMEGREEEERDKFY
jgi:hypothetical protein